MTESRSTDPVRGEVPESLLRLVADSVPALMAYYDTATVCCRFANQRYAEYNGWTPKTILGLPLGTVIGEAAYTVIEPHVRLVLAGQTVRYVREQTLPGGDRRMIEVSLIPHFSDAGPQIGAFVLINDITDQWRAELAVRESEVRMRRFADATEEGLVFHKDGVITDVNAALLRLSGYSPDELVGHRTIEFVPEAWKQTVIDYILAEGEEPYEAEIIHKHGHAIPVEMVGRTMPHEGGIFRMAVVRDITARKQAQERIEFLALHDVLTQLPNRHYLMEHLNRHIALMRRQQSMAATLFVDLDGFKVINDTLGHQTGDLLLRQIADRLKGAVRKADLVSRLGGDEFLVVLAGITQAGDAGHIAQNLLEALRPPMQVRDRSLSLSASIGISLFPNDGLTPDELIWHADAAMYQAKAAGGDAYRFFDPDMLQTRD